MSDNAHNKQAGSVQSLILIALTVAGVAIFFLLQTKDTNFNFTRSPQFEPGNPAPDFNLPDLEGTMVSIADYKGKIVLLNIWATWCPPCVEEMPSMENLYKKLSKDGFEILAISIDASGAETVSAFIHQHNLSFTVLVDPEGTIRSLYHTTGIPESTIIDKNGNIVEKIIGPRDWDGNEAVRYFRQLMNT